MSVFRPATLGGIEVSKNIANYKATGETELGALVVLNDTAKTFTTVASEGQAQVAVYALWQYLNADAHSVLGSGTNSHTVKTGEFGRLLYLPALVGLKDGLEIGGDIIDSDEISVGDILTANEEGYYDVNEDASDYAVAFVVRDIIEEYDFPRYICEVIIPESAPETV